MLLTVSGVDAKDTAVVFTQVPVLFVENIHVPDDSRAVSSFQTIEKFTGFPAVVVLVAFDEYVGGDVSSL